MIRRNKLVLGLGMVALFTALLAARPALAGNGGSNHGSNGNHGSHNSGHHGNFGHHDNFGHHGNFGFGHNGGFGNGGFNGGTFRQPVQFGYVVFVRQPNRYHDSNWHQVQFFGNQFQAQTFANGLQSKFYNDNGFAVRVDRRY